MEHIITTQLILRNFTSDDAKSLFWYLSNPRVNCFLSEKITTKEEALAEAEKKSSDGSYIAVPLKNDGCLIGTNLFINPYYGSLKHMQN